MKARRINNSHCKIKQVTGKIKKFDGKVVTNHILETEGNGLETQGNDEISDKKYQEEIDQDKHVYDFCLIR